MKEGEQIFMPEPDVYKCPRCDAERTKKEAGCSQCGYAEIVLFDPTPGPDALLLKDATMEQLQEEMQRKYTISRRETLRAELQAALTAIDEGSDTQSVMSALRIALHNF